MKKKKKQLLKASAIFIILGIFMLSSSSSARTPEENKSQTEDMPICWWVDIYLSEEHYLGRGSAIDWDTTLIYDGPHILWALVKIDIGYWAGEGHLVYVSNNGQVLSLENSDDNLAGNNLIFPVICRDYVNTIILTPPAGAIVSGIVRCTATLLYPNDLVHPLYN